MEKDLRLILRKHGFSFKKAFGQNFLTDTSLLENIVINAGVTKEDTVLEIGLGAGALTRELCKKAKKVVGYEIDYNLKPVLAETLEEFSNVEVVFSDIMKEKITEVERKLGGKYIMVANLPYYITTPIVMEFLEKAKNLKAMVIMVQEEVAERFASKSGTSDYGAITVAINLRGSAKIVMRVGREMFTPAPNVDSAVVKIDIEENKTKGVDLISVRDAVRVAFSSRRKMLVNNLMNVFKLSRAQAETALIDAGIETTVRGENLSAEDYVNLAEQIKKVKNNG
jgi:16S rRNA (adenine1518-N6/adenine1519-N6)-dimethyltransferase